MDEARAAGLVFGERYASVLLGTVRLEEGDIDAAQAMLTAAKDQMQSDPGLLDWFAQLPCLLSMARCAREQGRHKAAAKLANEGHALAKGLGEPQFLGRFGELLEG